MIPLEANIAANLREVRDRIANAAIKAGREPAGVTLVAVTKTKPIEAVRAAEPALPIGWLLEVTANLPRATATALDRHYQALHPFFVAVTSDFVEACHAGGLAVNVWTPNADAHIEAMLDAGVDALITDRLSAALDLVARRAQESGREANGGPHSG